MQTAALRALDAEIHASFADAGFSNVVKVTVPAGAAVVCDAYVDRTRFETGNEGSQVSQPLISITLQRAQIDAVPNGSLIVVAETGEQFTVDNVLPGDESLQVCIVVPVA